VGGSIYDWNTMSADTRAFVAERFANGPAANLPPP
jgi:hypothetical protein